MAYGLGMNSEEWYELRAQVDDSFWVMRIIGLFLECSGRARLKLLQVIRPFPTTMMVSLVEHTSTSFQWY